MEGRAFGPDYREASRLRMEFFKTWIIKRNPIYFKTMEERDWGYVAKREYNYTVLLKAIFSGLAVGNVAWSASIYLKKKFVILPLFLVSAPAIFCFRQYYFFKVNKRLFDMCNLGDEYELGAARNLVLAECNEIQDQEDF